MPKIEVVEHSELWYQVFYALKFPATLLYGVTCTLFLLYLMQYLIDSGEKALDETANVRFVDFVRLKEEVQVKTKQRKPKPPPKPDEPPPPVQQNYQNVSIDDTWSSQFAAPKADIDLRRSAAFASDGEYRPILKVRPDYPRMALQRGWFGWVLLEFTVDRNGRVVDPVIIESCVETYRPGGSKECVDSPGRIFDRPALAAVQKYKYKPKVVDGEPIETHGVQNKLTFILNEMRRAE